MCLKLDRCTPRLAIEEAGGHNSMHSLEETGGWHHMSGFRDLDCATFITGSDRQTNKQTQHNPTFFNENVYNKPLRVGGRSPSRTDLEISGVK